MYLVRVTPPMNFTLSDDSLFLKNILGEGHKFSEFAWYFCLSYGQFLRYDFIAFKFDIISIINRIVVLDVVTSSRKKCYVTCGHIIFMTLRYPVNNSDVIR